MFFFIKFILKFSLFYITSAKINLSHNVYKKIEIVSYNVNTDADICYINDQSIDLIIKKIYIQIDEKDCIRKKYLTIFNVTARK